MSEWEGEGEGGRGRDGHTEIAMSKSKRLTWKR